FRLGERTHRGSDADGKLGAHLLRILATLIHGPYLSAPFVRTRAAITRQSGDLHDGGVEPLEGHLVGMLKAEVDALLVPDGPRYHRHLQPLAHKGYAGVRQVAGGIGSKGNSMRQHREMRLDQLIVRAISGQPSRNSGRMPWKVANEPMVKRHDRRVPLIGLEHGANAFHQPLVVPRGPLQFYNDRHPASDQVECLLQCREMVGGAANLYFAQFRSRPLPDEAVPACESFEVPVMDHDGHPV